MDEFITQKENRRRRMALVVCIVLDVLAVALGGYSFKIASDLREGEDKDTVKKLLAEIGQQEQRIKARQANLIDFARPIGWHAPPRDTLGRWATEGLRPEGLKSFLDGWIDLLNGIRAQAQRRAYPAELAPPAFRKWDGREGGDPLVLTRLFDELQKLEQAYKRASDQLQLEVQKEQTSEKDVATTMEQSDQANKNEVEKADGLLAEYKKLLRELNDLQRRHGAEAKQLEEELDAKLRERIELANGDLKERWLLENARADLQTRINWIQVRREEAKERKEADGKILNVDGVRQIAYVDLAHRDRLFKGTRFKVYSLEKGGVKVDKGEVEIIEVGQDFSKAAIVRLEADAEPMRKDDRIYNEFYERGKPRYIAIAGRLKHKLSNEETARKIREFGDIYQGRADERTHYVVVGEGYDAKNEKGELVDENFKLALEYGIKILLEKHLYDYLGVP